MTTAAQALAIATRALPTESRPALHYALAVTRFETSWGDGWGQDGGGSNNWGAIQGTDPVNGFPHVDHHADGSPYVAIFKRYPTPEAGFKDAAFEILKPNVRAALETGDGTKAVNAQHANGYFEASPVKYAANVEANYNKFLAATGEPRLLAFGGVAASGPAPGAQSSGGGGLEALIPLGLALGAAWLANEFSSTTRKPPTP